MNEEEKFKALKHRAELSRTDIYKEILFEITEKIIESSSADEKELKGMLKLIKWVKGWEEDLDSYVKTKKGEK